MTNTTPPDEPANESIPSDAPRTEPTWADAVSGPETSLEGEAEVGLGYDSASDDTDDIADPPATDDTADAPIADAPIADDTADVFEQASDGHPDLTDELDADLEDRIAAAVAEEPHAESSGSWPPPPPPGPPPAGEAPYRRLYRSRDRKVGGVAGGIAAFTGIDPTIVRLATLLAAFTGVGVLIYIAAWWIVPEAPEGHHAFASRPPTTGDRSLSLALGVAAIALAIGVISSSWAVFALALIGAGIWLLSDQSALARLDAAVATPARAPAPATPAYRSAPPVADGYAAPPSWSGYDAPPPPMDSTRHSSPAAPRQTQRITWIVLSIVALIAAVAIAASAGNLWNVSATRTLGLAVIVIGVGVVAGVVRGGGARGLIPLGILATIALFPVSALDDVIGDGVGAESFRPADLTSLRASYQHGIGELVVDLSRIDLAGTSQTVDIDLGIGDLVVIVPSDVGGTAELNAKAGEVGYVLPGSAGSRFEDGLGVDTGPVRLAGENGELILDIDVGFGVAELRQARS